MAKHKRTGKFFKLREEAYYAQDGSCYWCGCDMLISSAKTTKGFMKGVANHPDGLTGDLLQQHCRQGEVSIDNVVAACRACNNTREWDRRIKPYYK